MYMSTPSEQVEKALLNCGLTQYKVAKESGVSAGMLSRFLSGQTSMSLRTLDKIAPLIGIKVTFHKPKKARSR